ncbi:MAG TPA: AMP-binding protein, partial [Pseudonocardia sp.]|nr:AMP-binding protein [Pseudonocardia sp.]
VLTRAGLHNRLTWMAAHYGIDETDVLVQKTPAGFDVSVWEFFLPFMVGAELVVARPDGHRDPRYLVELIQRTGVTTVHFVPSMLRAFLAEEGVGGCTSLRRVLCSGEELPTELAARCIELLGGGVGGGTGVGGGAGTELHNLYGPTEASIDVTATRYRGQPGPGVPIGRAIDGVLARVLDGALRPVPPGVPGELYLGGVQLARGYLNRPELTADRFVADLYGAAGERLYRTGDLVRALPDGTLVFLGRSDDQVKVRGVRVEPGETAAVLAAQAGVASAVVVARDDGPSGTWLVGYVVPGPGAALDPERLREAVAAALPDQFVPGFVMLLDELPLTTSGKVDRGALPAPVRTSEPGSRAPSGPVETRLCELFAEVLGLDAVAVDGNFFALGGDSISALRLASLARPAGLRFSPKQVFEAKTPAALALVAEPLVAEHAAAGLTTAGRASALAARDGSGEVPLTPIMRRLLDRAGSYRGFSQSVVLRTPAGLTEPQLRAGMRALLAGHDMLRARLRRDPEGSASLWIDDNGAEPNLDRAAGPPTPDELAVATDAAVRALDPAAGGMLRAVWFDAGGGAPGRLLLVAHHLVVDGVSWRILVGDLERACQGLPLEPVATSFRGWALELARRAPELAGQLPLWRDMLAGGPPRLATRPVDPARDVLSTTRRLVVRVSADVTRTVLTTLPGTLRAQTQDVLLAALLAAAARAGEPTPLVRLEGHGREEELVGLDGRAVDLTRTVGWFTTAFPVRLDASGADVDDVFAGGRTGGTLVKRVRDTLGRLPDHGAGYGVLRYLHPPAAAALAELTEPVIGFNYLGRFDTNAAGDWSLDAGALGGGGDPDMAVAHAVDINVLVDGEGIRSSWTYLPEVVPEATVRRLAEDWVAALRGLVRYGEDPDAAAPAAEDLSLVRVSASQLDRLRQRFES